jgi:hypothetical protein
MATNAARVVDITIELRIAFSFANSHADYSVFSAATTGWVPAAPSGDGQRNDICHLQWRRQADAFVDAAENSEHGS